MSRQAIYNYIDRISKNPVESQLFRDSISVVLNRVTLETSEAVAQAVVAARVRITTLEGDDAKCLDSLSRLLKTLAELDIYYKAAEARLKAEMSAAITVSTDVGEPGSSAIQSQ